MSSNHQNDGFEAELERLKLIFKGRETDPAYREFSAALHEIKTEHERTIQQMIVRYVEIMLNTLAVLSPSLKEQGRRVGAYAVATARKMGLPEAEVEIIRLAGLLHNYGSVAVPLTILNKPGRLTDDELEILQSSALKGAEILRTISGWEQVALLVANQSEWYTGQGGYPGRKHGEEIPLGSRIILVCKAYDAMTATRSYRQPMSTGEALKFLTAHIGQQYDPKVIEAFRQSLS